MVALHMKCNFATRPFENEMIDATNGATVDVRALARRLLGCFNATQPATSEAKKVA
jgi:hypothetical protein